MDVGDATLKLTGDTRDLDRALEATKGKVDAAMQKMSGAFRGAGIALTGLGVAGLAMVSSARKMNAQLGQTGMTIGATTKEMRALALSTTNVTFPLKSVTETFELLARAGVKDQEVLAATATAFDTLGDAIGMPAELVTAKLIPTMKTFNLTATEMAGKTDSLTYLFKKTTVSLDDFNRMIGYVEPELVEMGLTTEDMVAILAELEKQGYSGEVMTRHFRKAVTLAKKEQIPLNEALGITTETLESYKTELEGATGMTQEYADEANKQYGIMDKLKQKWSEITFQLGSLLTPLEPVLGMMTALGPVLIFLSTSAGVAAVKWALHAAALVANAVAFTVLHPLMAAQIAITKLLTVAQWLWNAAMTANPIGLVIIAIAALIAAGILLWKNWDKVKEKCLEIFGAIKDFIIDTFNAIKDFFVKTWDSIRDTTVDVWNRIKDFFVGLWNTITGVFIDAWDRLKRGAKKAFEAVANAMLWPIEKAVNAIIWSLNLVVRAINDVINAMNVIPGVDIPNVPEIPGWTAPHIELIKGGIVRRPIIAKLGEKPEAVIPLDRAGGMLGYRTANIVIELEGIVLAQALGEPLVDELRIRTAVKH